MKKLFTILFSLSTLFSFAQDAGESPNAARIDAAVAEINELMKSGGRYQPYTVKVPTGSDLVWYDGFVKMKAPILALYPLSKVKSEYSDSKEIRGLIKENAGIAIINWEGNTSPIYRICLFTTQSRERYKSLNEFRSLEDAEKVFALLVEIRELMRG